MYIIRTVIYMYILFSSFRHTKGEQRGSRSSSSACSASVPPSSQTPLRVSEWEGTQYVAPVSNIYSATFIYLVVLQPATLLDVATFPGLPQ